MKIASIVPPEEINLTLTMEEATWLKTMMQNPLTTVDGREPIEDWQTRKAFWHNLNKIIE